MRRFGTIFCVLVLSFGLTTAQSWPDDPVPDWYEDATCLSTILEMWQAEGYTPREVFEEFGASDFRSVGKFLKSLQAECPGVPAFNVNPVHDHVSGWEWPTGHAVDVSYYDYLAGGDPVLVGSAEVQTDDPSADRGWFELSLGEYGYDIVPGDIVIVDNGIITKMLLVSPITVTSLDVDENVVAGYASHKWVDVALDVWTDEGLHGQMEAARHGAFSFDLDTDLFNDQMTQTAYDLEPGSQGSVRELDNDNDSTEVPWAVPDPHVVANQEQDYVRGDQWPAGESVHVTIWRDDVLTHTVDALVEAWGPMPWEQGFHADLGFDLQVGDVVAATLGSMEQTVTVTDLSVDEIDPVSDTLTGTATYPGMVEANVYGEFEGASRWVTPSGGMWTAVFGDYGVCDESGCGDAGIDPGSQGDVRQYDDDGDATEVNWRLTNPRFVANPVYDNVWGEDWPVGWVELSVFDVGAFVLSETVEVQGYGDGSGLGNFGWDTGSFDWYDLTMTNTVTVTDGSVTKSLDISSLSVDEVDPASDVVTGTAEDPDAPVEVQIWEEEEAPGIGIDPDGDPQFVADFSEAGYDIQPGTQGGAREYDDDGDATEVPWSVSNPRIYANPAYDYVRGEEWPEGAEIDLAIYRGDVLTHTMTATVESWGPNPWEKGFDAPLDFDLQVGDMVTASDGNSLKELVVTDLYVDVVDPDAETVDGYAVPGAEVEVNVNQEDGGWRRVIADGSGYWLADFASDPGEFGDGNPDIQPGTQGDAREYDEDGDGTEVQWQLSNPRIIVDPQNDSVYGEGWPIGAEVELTLPGMTVTTTVEPAEWDPSMGWFSWPNEGEDPGLDLAPGDTVTATVGTVTKTHTVTTLSVDGIDADSDTLTGTASDGAMVEAGVYGEYEGANRLVTATGGIWTAVFGPYGECDEFGCGDLGIEPGSQGNAREYDDDGDATEVQWHLSNPRIILNPVFDSIQGEDWPAGAEVTITLPDNSTVTATVQPSDHDPSLGWFNWPDTDDGYDLRGGDVVTVTDGTTTKTHTITALTVAVDPAADTVSGTASVATAPVEVQIWEEGAPGRWLEPDDDPTYLADFSGEWDIAAGTEGSVREYEPDDVGDGDATEIPWRVPDPYFVVHPMSSGLSAVQGSEWTVGEAVIDVNGTLTTTVTVESGYPDVPWNTWFYTELTATVGDTVTVTQGGVVESHVVTTLSVDSHDPDAGTVSGTAQVGGAYVEVYAQSETTYDSAWRATTADGAGAWMVDVDDPAPEGQGDGTVSLAGGACVDVSALEYDAAGNATQVNYVIGSCE